MNVCSVNYLLDGLNWYDQNRLVHYICTCCSGLKHCLFSYRSPFLLLTSLICPLLCSSLLTIALHSFVLPHLTLPHLSDASSHPFPILPHPTSHFVSLHLSLCHPYLLTPSHPILSYIILLFTLSHPTLSYLTPFLTLFHSICPYACLTSPHPILTYRKSLFSSSYAI